MKMFLILISFVLGSSAFAAEDSGCGLGSLIIQKNSKVLQILSITTNALFFSQAFGITSGTSNCSASGLVKNDSKEVEYYVEVNQDDLSREMAQGQGEKLHTLAAMAGCDSTESQQAFYSMTKDSYAKIVKGANTSSQDLVENLKTQMMEDDDVALLCNTASL